MKLYKQQGKTMNMAAISGGKTEVLKLSHPLHADRELIITSV
jgi:hypothetical protein